MQGQNIMINKTVRKLLIKNRKGCFKKDLIIF